MVGQALFYEVHMNEHKERILEWTTELEQLEAELDTINSETVSLPSDMAMGFMSRRPSLFKLVDRALEPHETRAVLNALAGEMSRAQILSRIQNLQAEIIKEHIVIVTKARAIIN